MNDKSIMPWGKYRGKRMEEVPADYLLWLYDNNKINGKSEVLLYISENLAALREEVKKQKNFR